MEIVIYVVVAIVCLAVGFVVSRVVSGNGAKSAMAEAERKLADAEKSAENIRREATIEAKDKALRIKQQAEEEARRQTEEVRQQSKDMQARSERLEQRENSLDKRSSGLDKREQQLNGLQSRTESLSKKLETKLEEAERRLLDVASLSKEEAREIVLEDIREDCTAEAAGIIRDIESRTKAEANRKSREILSVAIQRMAAEGHQIGTHSYDHAATGGGNGVDMTRQSPEKQIEEVQMGQQAIADATGSEASKVFRSPGGNFHDEIIWNLQPYITSEIGWNVDTEDWRRPGADAIAERLLSVKPGDVVLMHDGGGDRSQTIEALKVALPQLRAEGYKFVTIDQLLAYDDAKALAQELASQQSAE